MHVHVPQGRFDHWLNDKDDKRPVLFKVFIKMKFNHVTYCLINSTCGGASSIKNLGNVEILYVAEGCEDLLTSDRLSDHFFWVPENDCESIEEHNNEQLLSLLHKIDILEDI